jgi:hypothetical protein
MYDLFSAMVVRYLAGLHRHSGIILDSTI